MAKSNWQCPNDWSEWSEWLAAGLHARNRWRLPVLLTGILFARGRRTVTTWLRAVGIRDDYTDYFYFLASLGRKTESVAAQLFLLLLQTLPLPGRLLAVIDVGVAARASTGRARSVWPNERDKNRAGKRPYAWCTANWSRRPSKRFWRPIAPRVA